MKKLLHFKEEDWVSNPAKVDIEISGTGTLFDHEPNPINELVKSIREKMDQLGHWKEV